MFHIHRWELSREVYTPPVFRELELEKVYGELAQQLLFGFTTFVMSCKGCSDVQLKSTPGDCRKASLSKQL